METKIYKYNGQEYKIKTNTLDVLNSAAPLILKLRQLYKYYAPEEIENPELKALQQKKRDLEIAISQVEDTTELEQKLKEVNEQLLNNKLFQATLEENAETYGFILLEVATDMKLIKPFLKKILIGDTDKLNYNDDGIYNFIIEIIRDFFLIILQKKII